MCSQIIATFLRTVFFLRKKRRARKNLSEAACFERKIFNFSFKNTLPPKNPFLHVFRAKRETGRKYLAIIYEHLLICHFLNQQ